MTNFYVLNCEFQITRDKYEISLIDGYAQEILLGETEEYKEGKYEYKITIKEVDISNYYNKMCMLYVSGYETKDDEDKTEIVISENIKQKIIFDYDFKSIRYLYPHADPEKDLAIYINVLIKAYYNISIYLNNENNIFLADTITRSQTYYVPASNISSYCEQDILCNIIVEITFINSLFDNINKAGIEMYIRQIKSIPSYLKKSEMRIDFTYEDRFYYLYTDIGKYEIGEVSIKFFRDFGYVWGKIVRKDQIISDEEANWRGIYRMPSEDWKDSLPYDIYNNKLIISKEDTIDCIDGCYLLLSIQVSQFMEYINNDNFYPFSIIVKISPNNYAYRDIPKISIKLDEYIVGNADLSENERIYQFYEIWLPYDSDVVEFELQSSLVGLYINLGGIRPTAINADFKLLPPGRDSILNLNKTEIIARAKLKKIALPYENSIEDLNLVIGIWSNKTDSIDNEIFSLRIHEPNSEIDKLSIMEVKTEHKILCNPLYLTDNLYRCLFMIIYDERYIDLGIPLLIHAASLNQNSLINIYASFVDRKYYDYYDREYLMNNTPTNEISQYSTSKNNKNYLYITLNTGNRNQYLFVSVITDIPDDIMLLTYKPTFNNINSNNFEYYLSPATEQLYFSANKLRFKFFKNSTFMVNIVSLDGEGEVSWSDDPNNIYNLKGREDRLSLISGKNVDELIISNKNVNDNKLFIFYISYFTRNSEDNFDKIQYGKSMEIGYRNTDLPIYLFSVIGNSNNDINIAVSFKDLDNETKGEYKNPP